MSLPKGFELIRGRRGRLARADAVARALEDAGFAPDGDERELPASDVSGRHPLGQIECGSMRLLVRRYAHGGLLRWLTGERFADWSRPFDELRLADALRERGVRTPKVVAARAVRARLGVGWRLALVSERVENSTDLATLVESFRRGEHDLLGLRATIRSLGVMLRQLHDLGLEHVDLQLRNILSAPDSEGESELWIIDLDRSRLGRPLDREKRLANLARLARSAERRSLRGRPVLTRTDLVRLLRAYAGEADWRPWVEGVAGRRRQDRWRHQLGWWLEKVVGADPARRDGSARID
ncbi:MAG: lipopolysaccharide kinase InaA family protein [Planctomycetota bacterium]